MFDEYGEGNQIAKTAESQSQVPAGSGLLALNEDGTVCSSDYYLRLTADGGRMLKKQIALTATRPTPPVATSGTPGTTVVSLRAHANGKYVTAPGGGAQPLIAASTAVGVAETFDMITVGTNQVAFRAHANGLIVTAENAGANPLIANRTAIQLWETFNVTHNPDGSTSFTAAVNSRFVTAENAGASALIANRTAVGGWEEFDVTSL
jgi:hypothetical protein